MTTRAPEFAGITVGQTNKLGTYVSGDEYDIGHLFHTWFTAHWGSIPKPWNTTTTASRCRWPTTIVSRSRNCSRRNSGLWSR